MKKITKTNLQGLRQLFPVLGKEEMRCHVGGNSDGYYGNDWFNHGYGGYDPDGNKLSLRLREELSIAFQHEVDHLNGILFFERINKKKPFFTENEIRLI